MKKGKSEKKEIRISGIINSLEWDDDDNITEIEISTAGEDYIVDPSGIGKELFDYVGEDVEVVGTVSKAKGDNNVIKIIKYELLDYEEDDDYEDDDDY